VSSSPMNVPSMSVATIRLITHTCLGLDWQP